MDINNGILCSLAFLLGNLSLVNSFALVSHALLVSISTEKSLNIDKIKMKNRDLLTEQLSDVKNVDEPVIYPGQYTPFDMSLFYPGGMVM